MSYLALDLVFLALAGAVAAAAVAAVVARRRRAAPNRRLVAAIGITAVITVTLTAVFDNLMIAVGLFSYNPDRLLGARVGLVPVEDFAYPMAAVLLLPALWVLTGIRRRPHE